MFNLEGKKALITGASGGIGQEIATIFSEQGAIVGLCGTREQKLKDLADKISGESHIFPCNLSNVDEVETLFERAEEQMGTIDILVCNAGITKDNLVLRMKNEDWDDVININLKSTFLLNRAAVKKWFAEKMVVLSTYHQL